MFILIIYLNIYFIFYDISFKDLTYKEIYITLINLFDK